jgi:hypothetical protein
MSRTKNNLMDKVDKALYTYNPATREYEPAVTRLTDSELAGQTIGESMERLRLLIEQFEKLTILGDN